ncbi:hypothetical protein EN871_31235 [bacterium M00.F.Ca.ET.228.01.1.1]|nr:hypothetical protein EN871_31235 [bacterium M00.F.Ca.ET.228.01.1.1]TGR95542.1 hypothetical protein EN834_30840 [bacterium M00.F.Ca.ET.191.01.1.1]TGT96531.1 hypothetical protein EN798_30850 [bacterium M00.F.Ca.ET.155.01.1.1]
MNSSMHFLRADKATQRQPVAPDNRCVPDVIWERTASCSRRQTASAAESWAGAPRSMSTAAGESRIHAPSLNNRIAARPADVTCGDIEPTIVRFIDGAASRGRRVTLVEKMHQLGPWPGQTLLVRSSEGGLWRKLELARYWTEAYRIHHHLRPVIGIDGLDQWQVSPGSSAAQLQALLVAGANVVLAVDCRYCDFSLLVLDLHVRGISVWREKRLPAKPFRVSHVSDALRYSAASNGATRSEPYARTSVSVPAGYPLESHDPDSLAAQRRMSAGPGPKMTWPEYEAPDSVFPSDERGNATRKPWSESLKRRILQRYFGIQA